MTRFTLVIPSALAAFALFAGCARMGERPDLDIESKACVKCHALHKDHPVGTDYAESFRLKKTGLAPPSSLDPSVRLVNNGRVGCVTCHIRYSEVDHRELSVKRKSGSIPDPMLVIDNSKSGLCLACHRK